VVCRVEDILTDRKITLFGVDSFVYTVSIRFYVISAKQHLTIRPLTHCWVPSLARH